METNTKIISLKLFTENEIEIEIHWEIHYIVYVMLIWFLNWSRGLGSMSWKECEKCGRATESNVTINRQKALEYLRF